MLDKFTPARRNLALAVVVLFVGWFCWTVRAALNPLLLALLLAYMLHPLVLRLEKRGWSRKRAVNAIFAAFALSLVLLAAGVYAQGKALVQDVGERHLLEKIDEQLERGWNEARGQLEQFGVLDPEAAPSEEVSEAPSAAPGVPVKGPGLSSLWRELSDWLSSERGQEKATQTAGGTMRLLRRLFDSLLGLLGLLFLVPLYTWFLLFELERVARFERGFLPRQHRARLADIGERIADMLGKFFHGRLLVCLLKGLTLSLIYAVLQVPYAFLLGMLGGFLSLLPFVGPGLGYVLGFLLSLIAFEPVDAVWRLVVVWTVGELFEGYVLMPKVLGESMGLHPIVVIAAFTIAGSALGMLGLILALPLTATAIILVRELILPGARAWAEDGQSARRAKAQDS